MRENYSHFSNYSFQSKDTSVQTPSFPTRFHNSRHFVNEFLPHSILNVLGLVYYI